MSETSGGTPNPETPETNDEERLAHIREQLLQISPEFAQLDPGDADDRLAILVACALFGGGTVELSGPNGSGTETVTLHSTGKNPNGGYGIVLETESTNGTLLPDSAEVAATALYPTFDETAAQRLLDDE